MRMLVKILILFYFMKFCAGVIYNLNESEYERMPPLYGLDKFDQCMNDENSIYCVAMMELFSDAPNDLMTLIQEYSAHTYKHYDHNKIGRGVCVTRSCRKLIKSHEQYTEAEIGNTLEECVNESIWNEYGLQTKLLKHFCVNRNEKTQMDIYDYLFMCLLFSLLLLNITGTVCDFILQKQNYRENNYSGIMQYLTCFSIAQNWNWLVSSTPEDSKLRNLKGLNGIKSIVLFSFIIHHVFYVYSELVENTHTMEEYYDHLWYQILFNGLVLAQSLFCISGFLLMYNLLLESEKRDITWKMVPKIVLLRLWRLAPANVIYVLFSATLCRFLGNGPIWKSHVVDHMSRDCRRYWWAHLLFINNYFTDDKYCVVQNWQLATDVQLLVLGLCIFVATKSKHRVLVLSSMALLGIINMGVHIWWNDLEAFPMFILRSPYMDSNDVIIRKFTHNNLQSYMIGMLTGFYIYHLQKNKFNFSKYKSILGPAVHFILPCILFLFYSGSYFYSDAEKTSLSMRIAYGILLVPVLALFVSFILFAMVFRFNDFWTRFVEWDGWIMPGRLSYSISLLHTFFILYVYGSRTQLLHVSAFNHAILYFGIGCLSFIFAIPYFLMVEAPFNRLAKVFVSQKMQQSSQVKKVE